MLYVSILTVPECGTTTRPPIMTDSSIPYHFKSIWMSVLSKIPQMLSDLKNNPKWKRFLLIWWIKIIKWGSKIFSEEGSKDIMQTSDHKNFDVLAPFGPTVLDSCYRLESSVPVIITFAKYVKLKALCMYIYRSPLFPGQCKDRLRQLARLIRQYKGVQLAMIGLQQVSCMGTSKGLACDHLIFKGKEVGRLDSGIFEQAAELFKAAYDLTSKTPGTFMQVFARLQ